MFSDIFSSFDPSIVTSSSTPVQSVWLLRLLVLLPIAPTYWLAPSQTTWLTLIPLNFILLQLNRSSGRHLLGWNSITSSLFIILLLNNLIRLTPYTFRLTSHLLFTLTFGLTGWTSLIISSFINSPIKFLAILLPGGAPLWLNPFLVAIESRRISARPATLSFRLAANMRAGHIVITLLCVYTAIAFITSTPLLLLLLSLLVPYILFEIGICLIQAFIFCLLLSIFSNEHT